MEETKFEGDFIDTEDAREKLVHHLNAMIRYVETHEVINPAMIGQLAASLEAVVHCSETYDSVEFHPSSMFQGGYVGDYYDDEQMNDYLNFDREEIQAKRDEIDNGLGAV